MATPGSTAATSRRASAMAPANPVATAATRSRTPGEVRAAICESASSAKVSGRSSEKIVPIAMTSDGPGGDRGPRPAAGRAVALGQAEGDAHDRRRQRCDDHRADDGGGGVGQDPRGRDERREGEHRPEGRPLGGGVAVGEVEVGGQLGQGSPLVIRQQRPEKGGCHGSGSTPAPDRGSGRAERGMPPAHRAARVVARGAGAAYDAQGRSPLGRGAPAGGDPDGTRTRDLRRDRAAR